MTQKGDFSDGKIRKKDMEQWKNFGMGTRNILI